MNLVMALMEQVEGLRGDIAKQTETISNKLDAQTRETRSEFKELREDISEIKSRLASGSEQIRSLRKDVDAQGAKCAVHGTTALEKRPDPQLTTDRKAKTANPAWWLILLAGGALAYVGERGVKFIINGMADPPPAVQLTPTIKP
jgi:septal ring factor EnvC (AmiA/AmiB activator)